MKSYTTPLPNFFNEPDTAYAVEAWKLVNVEVVRDRDSNKKTSCAWEITLRVPTCLNYNHIGIRPGMQIGLIPQNDDSRVTKLLSVVSDVPQDKISISLAGRGYGKISPQLLTPSQVIAHTVDLTRPTQQLYDFVAFIRQPGDGWDVPLEKFMANLDDIVSSNGQVKSLHKILNTNAPQVSKKLDQHSNFMILWLL